MRLEKIKLAGFKSFVDPTTVGFPSNLSGIVGPNGCGKSNVIDAVRWVMGESSAKNLRGESITDVIFNGAGNRSPSGQASIELHFDNSDGRLGGAYQQYGEIVIRRQVNLEGHSTYYLNGSVCRRRDITDIFLGTGLGPRSYAIIEQGTISKLIEAKPQDLRNYLEEAAGISKYKERRRETELRLGHTRDNLSRMNDIREELQKQLDHLSKQAEVAEKFQKYKDEEKLLKGQIYALKAKDIEQQIAQHKEKIIVAENQLEALNTHRQTLLTQKEIQQQERAEFQENADNVQKTYYEINTELAKIEQQLSYYQEQKGKIEQQIEKLTEEKYQAENHLVLEKQRKDELSASYQKLIPELSQAQTDLESVRHELADNESNFETAQEAWNKFQQEASLHLQQSQIEQTNIQHIEKRISDINQRISRLSEEQTKYQQLMLDFDLSPLQEKIIEHQTDLASQEKAVLEDNEQLKYVREENQQTQRVLDEYRTSLQTLKGKLASLQALQEAALGKNNQAQQQFLEKFHLDKEPRLAEKIKVQSGWEKAVETMLSQQLESICLERFEEILAPQSELFNALKDIKFSLHFLNTQSDKFVQESKNTTNSVLLTSLCEGPQSVLALLSNVYTAETLEAACEILPSLQDPKASVITREGLWIGRNFVRVVKMDDQKGNVILREKMLLDCQHEIQLKTGFIQEQQEKLEANLEQIKQLEFARDEKQKMISELTRTLSESHSQLKIQQSEQSQHEQRKTQCENEIGALQNQKLIEEQALNQSKQNWDEALIQLEKDNQSREYLQSQTDNFRQSLQLSRANYQKQQQLHHGLSTQVSVLETQQKSSQEMCDRLSMQIDNTEQKKNEAQQELVVLLPLQEEHQKMLSLKLTEKSQVEKSLQDKREQLSHCEQVLRELEKSLQVCDGEREEQLRILEQHRITLETVTVNFGSLKEKSEEIGEILENLCNNLPEELNIHDCEERLSKITARIERLGLINLAAISEHAQLLERKTYLDTQHQDLITALELLEEAIQKIDKETRLRFKETYEKVNALFKELFPKIFGGGQAYLELTGDDLLETGVQVIARPPGKRNSTIHLLSGGEKALTAMALVFSIFQLNPAPFCMLDEVDAPLDDANIGRFCGLVKEMSKSVQFIFISHNKLAIEMAEHLIGVTMGEPGVSRLVAVDVQSAMEMAEA